MAMNLSAMTGLSCVQTSLSSRHRLSSEVTLKSVDSSFIGVSLEDGWRKAYSLFKNIKGVRCSSSQPPPAWPGRAVFEGVKKNYDGPKPISLIGSTGSIGTQTLDIVAENPGRFRVVGLAAGSNITLLAEQIRAFKPSLVSIRNSEQVAELKEAIADVHPQPEIVVGDSGIVEVARHPEAVTVVTGIVGCAGLKPTVAAIEAGKDIALANKETLIAGGPYVLPLAKKYGCKILPADSEHSAIFQCIQGLPEGGLRRIILTASGGAFRDWPVERLKDVKVSDALKHPNWVMGRKITVDSATLMNGPEGWQLDESVWSRGLPDDVYCTILAHLPLSSFYQLRTVCKSWSLMPSDKSFLEACSRVGSRTPSLLLMGKDYCCAYEPAVNEWKSIPLSFFLPRDSEAATYVVSSAGGRVLLLRRCRLLLHNPLNNSLKLLPPMLDMDRSDLPTVFDIHIIGMFVSDNDGDEISILVMNKTTNFEEEFDSDYDGSEPIISQVYNSRADSWQMITDFEPPFKLSISSAAMVDAKLRFVISSFRHYPSCSSLSMYSVKPSSSTSWEKEKIRMPHLGLRLVAPHLFTYRGALLLVAALPTDETRNDRFPTWNNVTVWELSASSNPRGSDGHWNRVLEVGPKELNDELWNTSLESFFFLSDGDFIYFGSRSGSSLGMINLKSKTWRLLPLFPGITSHFTGSIEKMSLQTFLFQPRFDVVV